LIMNLFISRELSSSSLFHLLSNEGINVFDKSLIDFYPLPFNPPKTKWVFFYSKKGIEFYFKNTNISTDQKYAVMGPSSASYFELTTGKVAHFIGNNDAPNIAKKLISELKGGSITFIKAKKSIESVEKHLPKSDQFTGLPVYLNSIKNKIAIDSLNIPYCNIIVLTSPMNATAWFNHQPYNNENIIAIGKTTAQKISSIINKKVKYCSKPSENALYELVRKSLC